MKRKAGIPIIIQPFICKMIIFYPLNTSHPIRFYCLSFSGYSWYVCNGREGVVFIANFG
jgi:hypothetical protein